LRFLIFCSDDIIQKPPTFLTISFATRDTEAHANAQRKAKLCLFVRPEQERNPSTAPSKIAEQNLTMPFVAVMVLKARSQEIAGSKKPASNFSGNLMRLVR